MFLMDNIKKDRQLVLAKFVYVLVCMHYFLAAKYKHKLQGESCSAGEKTAHYLTLAVKWDVKIELKYSRNFCK